MNALLHVEVPLVALQLTAVEQLLNAEQEITIVHGFLVILVEEVPHVPA